MQVIIDTLTNKQAMEGISKLEDVFKNAPHLPKSWVKFLVKIVPWLALLGGIANILGGLSTLSYARRGGAMFELIAGFANIHPAYFVISGLLSIAAGGLVLMAFSRLREKLLTGWVLLFWSSILGIGQSLLSLFFAYGSVIGMAIGVLISWYLLFEIKPSYKK